MMDVTRNVGNNHIDSDKHMDLKHWKRIISTVSSIDNSFKLSISISYYLAFVSVSYYGGSILGINHFKRNPKWLLPDGIIWIPYQYIK